MASNITVPSLGESITEAIVASLTKSVGDFVVKNEILCELETEKVTIEVSVNVSGKLAELKVGVGDTVAVGSIIAIIDDNASLASETHVVPISDVVHSSSCEKIEHDMPPAKSAIKMAQMINLDLSNVKGSGKRNQILKEDVINASMGNGAMCTDDHKSESSNNQDTTTESVSAESIVSEPTNVVPMSKLRQTIATRLKEAQNKAAILSTFNEIDMSAVMDLRAKYKDVFEKKHGIKIGFMSFFAKAAAVVLKEIPSVNAEISSSGNDIIFKNYYHIGVAVGIDRGLVVPVVRHVDRMSFADIEKAISALGKKARDYKLSMSDMRGGTFTISNGGIYGSLLSTPIINTPQSGILGLHNIVQRPVVVDGAIVIRSMMYVALSYDHRLVDGKDAVTFLVRIKQLIECPQRLLLAL